MKFIIKSNKLLPHQKKFITSKKSIKALVSGYGAGKTYIFLRETLKNHINLKNHTGKSNGWIVYPTRSLAEELFVIPFQELLEKCNIQYDYNKSKMLFASKYGYIRLWHLQKPQRMVGSELTFCGFDEFDVESVKNCKMAYEKAIGRMRGAEKTVLYFVTTPEGFKTTYEIFVENATDEKKLIKAKTSDNPYLPEHYIQQLKANYDPVLLQQYFDGEFVNLKGHAAYYAFDRAKHIIEVYKNTSQYILIGMDFNVDPMCAVVGTLDIDGTLIIFDEYYLKNSNTWAMCENIQRDYLNYNIVIYPDMTGVKRTTNSIGYSDIKILRKAGFEVRGNVNPLVRDRLNTVNNAFSKRYIKITKNCKHLIQDLDRVITDERGNLDKSNIELTHISDAFGYLVCREFPIKKRNDFAKQLQEAFN